VSAALLEIDGLTKSFGGIRAVRECTFSVPEGQVIGLIGPNGAGKSTVVDLVSGFTRPDAGSVRLAGEQLVGKLPDVIARLGLIRTFQTPREWRHLTVMDNVLLARCPVRPRVPLALADRSPPDPPRRGSRPGGGPGHPGAVPARRAEE